MKIMQEDDWRRPYRYLAAVHSALIVIAGAIVVRSQWPFWSQYVQTVGANRLLLSAVLIYAALDLIRIPFAGGSVTSLGLPLLLIVLLARADPRVPILVVVVGSLLREFAYSGVYRRLKLRHGLVRAVLYAGHHAVASCAAAIAFVVFYSLDLTLDSGIKYWLAIGVYALIYGAISMLILWPHDWWVSRLLAPQEEQLPRVEIIFALLVATPMSIALDYLNGMTQGPSRLVFYFLLLLFLVFLVLVRSFAVEGVEKSRAITRRFAEKQIGSPPNLAELTQSVFNGAGRLAKYEWGALYSTEAEGESFRLRGHKRADGHMAIYGLRRYKERDPDTAPGSVEWPDVVRVGEGILGRVVQQGKPLVSFEWTGQAVEDMPHLPANTALVALPIRTEKAVIGLLALARARKLFTQAERDRAQALTEALGGILHSVQSLESQLQELYREIEQFGQPEIVQQALKELIQLKVDMPRLMAAISERTFKTNLRAVLRGTVGGRGGGGRLALSPDELEEIYKEVQAEKKDMPPWSLEVLEKLQTVTSALSFPFSFRYQWPHLVRSPEYENLYKVLAQALGTRTVPDIVAQESGIADTIRQLKTSSLVARDAVFGQLGRLQEIIALLREAEEAEADMRPAYLGDALQKLRAAKDVAESKLEDPERFTLVQIATTWQGVVTNALYAALEGGARLAMALGSHWALPLEEITVQLRLENRGPGLASGVVAEIQPSEDYQIGEDGRVELGALFAGDSRGVDFKIRPLRGRDELHLMFQVTYRDRERRRKREAFGDQVQLRKELAPFTGIDNPYVAGKALPTGSPLFFGREDVFEFIRRNVAGSTRGKYSLLLLGERRTGKTSILKQLPEQLKDEPFVHVFFDCQGLATKDMAGFFLNLSSVIARGLRDTGLPIEELEPGNLRDQPQFVFEEEFLPRVWERIGDRSLLLAIDEFEALETRVWANQLDPTIFPYLRSLMQFQDRIALIFVSTHRLEELTTDYWSVLFNIVKTKRISFLDRESAVRLITEPVRRYDVVYDDLALDEVLRLTAGHPYFLQLVCDALMDHCNDRKRNYVTIQDVRDVQDEVTGQGRTHLLFVWGQSSREERAVLAALGSLLRSQQRVAAVDVVEHLVDRVGSLVDHMPFDLRAVTGALGRLVSREIVKETSEEPPAYAFTAGLYGELIARYKSLYRVAPELVEEPAGTPPAPVSGRPADC